MQANIKNRKKLQLIQTWFEMSWLSSHYFTFHWKLLVLVSRIQKSGTWDNSFGGGKAHFGPTDRNDQTCHCRPPSKLVPNSLNIPVGPNRNGPFHLMNQPKFPEFWVTWKAPLKTTSTNGFNFRMINFIHLWYLAGYAWPGLTWDVQGCHKWSLVLLSSMYFPRLA